MDLEWASAWGNWVVTHRSPDTWRAYGEEAGYEFAANEWDEFVFWRDPKNLALTPKAVQAKADATARELVDDFRLFGASMWKEHSGENHGTPEERRIWVKAFVQAYTETLAGPLEDLIPAKLWKNLDLFCTLLSWLRMDMDHGDGRAEEYGLRLGGKGKAQPEPAEPTYRPSRSEMRAVAQKLAKDKLEHAWKRFMARQSGGSEFRSSMLRYELHPADAWAISDLDRDYMAEVLIETFHRELGKKALQLAPASAWENAYLICVLHEHLKTQEAHKKKVSEDGPKGFWRRDARESAEEERERAAWREAERERIRKELERKR